MKKILNLGHGCWQKLLIKEFDPKDKQNQISDIFDWMKSFSFEKMIDALESGFDIFDKRDIKMIPELKAYHNNKYQIYLPHETPYVSDLSKLDKKYKRRYERFLDYKKLSGKCIIIREVTMKQGDFSVRNRKISDIEKCEFPNDYNKQNYDRIMKFLPDNCPFILFVYRKLTQEEREKIYHKFIVIEEMMDFQQGVRFDKKIIQKYKIFFEKLSSNNFLEPNKIKEIFLKCKS